MSNFHQTMRAGSTILHHGGWRFTGQHVNPVRAKRRKAIKEAGGIRQYKLLTGYWRQTFF